MDSNIKPQSALRKWVGYFFKFGIPLLVTVLLCNLLFRDVDINEMVTTIKRDCDWRWIGLALVISIFSHVFRAMRWRIQLRAIDVRPPLFTLVLSIFGTYAVNLVLPRLGELWRTGYIAKRQDAPFSQVFGSMVADRLADTVTVLLLTIITFLLATTQLSVFFEKNQAAYQRIIDTLSSPWLWLAVAVLLAFVVWFFRVKTTNAFIIKVQNFGKGLWDGFAVIAKMRGKGQWLLLTVCIWGCYFMQLYVAFFAFGFTADVAATYGVLAVLVTFILSSISMGVPSNGGIGPWQWAVIFALGLYHLPEAQAATFANLVMGTQTLLLIVLGLFTFVCISLQKRKNNIKTCQK